RVRFHPSGSLSSRAKTLCVVFFFFSSRRRHTSSYGDWSSDVCSSDLASSNSPAQQNQDAPIKVQTTLVNVPVIVSDRAGRYLSRSEERRVGKECSCGGMADDCKQKCVTARGLALAVVQ